MPTASEIVSSIKFTSILNAGQDFRRANVPDPDLAPVMNATLAQSEFRALRLTKGILQTAPANGVRAEADRLFAWARTGNSTARRTLATGYRQSYGTEGNVFMVHQISLLPQTEARVFMADYFAAGGDMKGVADYLRRAGAHLRSLRGKDGTAGFLDAVGDFFGDVVDTVVEGVTGVVDAIVDAGRSIAELAGEILSWTVSEVGDLIEALIEAGRSLGNVLSEALAAGAEALTKFARAAIDIGRTIGDVLAWGVQQAGDALQTVVEAILDTVADVGTALAWATTQAISAMNSLVGALIAAGRTVGSLIAEAADAATDVLAATVRGLRNIGRAVAELIVTVITRPRRILDALVDTLEQIGESIRQIFDAVADAAAGVLEAVVEAARRLGHALADLVEWVATTTAAAAQRALRTLLNLGNRLIDIMAHVTSLAVAGVRRLVGAIFDIGRTLVNLMHELFDMSLDAFGRILRAALELGRTVAEFVGAFVGFTYRSAVRLARFAFEAGLTVAELIGAVAGETYFVFRRVANAILDAAGPVGDLMQWVLDNAETAVGDLWRQALLAIRFSGNFIFNALDWAIDQGEAVFEEVLRAWESIDQTLLSAYDWMARNAARLGGQVFEMLGRVTVKLENSIDYVLNFLQNDFIEGARLFARGVLQAGFALASLVTSLAGQSARLVLEVVRGVIDTGATLGNLVAAIIAEPRDVRDHVLQALNDIGTTRRDVLDAARAIGDEAVDAVVRAWRRLGVAGDLILQAAWEIGGGLFGLVVSSLLNLLATYRPLSAVERDDATFVFGDSIDLDRVFVSREDPANDIIFRVQDFLNGTPDSRAFVTTNLINFDVTDAIEIDDAGTLGMDRRTFIHELTHVWQSQVEGPLYMSQAIHAQVTSDAYNYGNHGTSGDIEIDVDAKVTPTRESSNNIGRWIGEGGQAQLAAANGDLLQFNVEAQAEIISHWFARARLNPTTTTGAVLSTADWDPFIPIVRQPV